MAESRKAFTRRAMLKATGGLGTAAAAGIAPSAAGVLAQDEEPAQGGTLTYGNDKPPQNVINPLNTLGTGQNVLIEAMFLRLVYGVEWGDGINPQASGPIEMSVAESMT